MLTLCVRSITYEAEGIRSFELVDPSGKDLPAFEAGAHIDVKVPGGYTRQYSLCDAPWQRRHYRIAVLEDPQGRGGSAALHARIRAGDLLQVSEPRNLFPLHPQAGHCVLLAGGIGITPLMAMAEQLRRSGRSFELHYCTQTPERTAFRERLRPWEQEGRVRLHHDRGDPRQGLDIAGLLHDMAPDRHLYFCGPPGFMKAVQQASAHWPAEQVHFEHFGAMPSAAPAPAAADGIAPAEIRLARSDKVLPVAGGASILQTLREAGVACESSCEAGVCGCCRVRYLSGEPEHNDFVLSDEEKKEFVLVCCAGVGKQPLLLDL